MRGCSVQNFTAWWWYTSIGIIALNSDLRATGVDQEVLLAPTCYCIQPSVCSVSHAISLLRRALAYIAAHVGRMPGSISHASSLATNMP